MSLPSVLPSSSHPADPDHLSAPRPGVGAADLARLARLFATRGILLLQGPLPDAAAPVCPQCGCANGWYMLLLTQERVCRCRLMPEAAPGAG